ncbi:MAG: zinc-binding dehydrogenase, partial [Candidatus Eremiobacteraeota bacterium]|nr:zinc-binding dehydrogenase [Candidatus Eremiobacteraeota bacterium]
VRLGAAHAINYRAEDFVEAVKRITEGRSVDVILDIVGGDYIARDVECLAPDGRIACVSTQRGNQVDLDLRRLFAKRGTIMASTLRSRSTQEKAAIARDLEQHIWPLLPARDRIVPVIDSVYPFERAADAHVRMESSAHIGKIVLVP